MTKIYKHLPLCQNNRETTCADKVLWDVIQKGEKDITIITINEEEEDSEAENNSCDENENFILKEKHLVHRTISESMINITFE